MDKKIIVAGAGHGGLAAAARLAGAGLDVTVLEKNTRKNMGYDWTDIFAPKALFAAGMKLPPEDKFEYKTNMTFFSPDMKTPLEQAVPQDMLEIKMERKDIYDMLITEAENGGAKLNFGCEVLAPIMAGDRVIGVHTSEGDYFADLVIDAAGINSPVRKNLPAMCGIEKQVSDFEQFYVYRAFYNKVGDFEPDAKYKVMLLPQGKLGIGWVATEEKYVDVLIGRFKPFDMDEVEDSLEFFRELSPQLGKKRVRGGQFVNIPVRQPLSVLVANGYAAIGDSAFMTVPVIGSGIANTLKASRILCDTILCDVEGAYSAESLWKYQVRFFKEIGSGLAPLACVKNLLTKLKPQELDYMFASGILTAKDLTIGADSNSLSSMISAEPKELLQKARHLGKNGAIVHKVAVMGMNIGSAVAVTAAMPKTYRRSAVSSWARRYKRAFKV